MNTEQTLPESLPEPPPESPCAHCGELCLPQDLYQIRINGYALHYECLARRFVGSVAHQTKHGFGKCYDDPSLTRRQAAAAALEHFRHDADGLNPPGCICPLGDCKGLSDDGLTAWLQYAKQRGFEFFALVPHVGGVPGEHAVCEFSADGRQFGGVPLPQKTVDPP